GAAFHRRTPLPARVPPGLTAYAAVRGLCIPTEVDRVGTSRATVGSVGDRRANLLTKPLVMSTSRHDRKSKLACEPYGGLVPAARYSADESHAPLSRAAAPRPCAAQPA